MKAKRPATALLFVVALIAGLAVAVTVGCDDDDGVTLGTPRIVDGSGVVVDENRSASGCAAVSFASEGDLHLVPGSPEGLRIRTDDNLLPYLQSRMSGDTLEIWTTPGMDLRPTGSIDFYLTVPTLRSIDHSGVGRTEGDGLVTSFLEIFKSGTGAVELTGLEVADLTVVMDGVGGVHLAGAAGGIVDRQDVTVSGVGSYDARSLSSTEAMVLVDGLGTATVCVSTRLEVLAGGAGSVSYYGSPLVVPAGSATQVNPSFPCN